MKEYLATIERFRAATMDRLVLQYKSIGPLLTKVAVLVGEESAHRLPKYYGVWEKRIFSALTDMVLKNLRLATHLMHNSSSPLFRVDVRLSAPELVLVPSAGELYRMLRRMFRSLLDSLKGFYRWQHGTCVLTKELVVEGEDTPVVFSFYDDVSVHPQVVAEINEVERVIKEMFDAIAAYLSRWKRYSALWKLDKSGSVTKFAAKNPSCAQYDNKLHFYTRLSDEVMQHKPTRRIVFVELYLPPLMETVGNGALSWVESLGGALADNTQQRTEDLHERMDEWSQRLKAEPSDLDALKSILRTMAEIRDQSLVVQLEMDDLLERLRTLEKYDAVKVEEATQQRVLALPDAWQRLVADAEEVDDALVAVKFKFSRITNSQVKTFVGDTEALADEFHQQGPAAYVLLQMREASQDGRRGRKREEEWGRAGKREKEWGRGGGKRSCLCACVPACVCVRVCPHVRVCVWV